MPKKNNRRSSHSTPSKNFKPITAEDPDETLYVSDEDFESDKTAEECNIMADSDSRIFYHTVQPFMGVQPQCLRSRWFHVLFDSKKLCLSIQEYHWDSITEQFNEITDYTIDVTAVPMGTIIGNPLCIACQHEWLVVQYITQNYSHIKFMLVNLSESIAIPFEDGDRYFKKDFVCAGPLECHISKALECILIRLPRCMLTKKKSWVLSTALQNCDAGNYKVENLHKHSLQTNNLQLMVMHPTSKGIGYVVKLGSSFCEKYSLQMIELHGCNEHYIVKETTEKIRANLNAEEYLDLAQVNIGISYGGDWLVLCIHASIRSADCNAKLKSIQIVNIINADNLDCVCVNTTFLNMKNVGQEFSSNMLATIFTACDTSVKICIVSAENGCSSKLQLRLPVVLNLQKLCRSVIRKNCIYSKQVDKLVCLPTKLQNYLKYKVH